MWNSVFVNLFPGEVPGSPIPFLLAYVLWPCLPMLLWRQYWEYQTCRTRGPSINQFPLLLHGMVNGLRIDTAKLNHHILVGPEIVYLSSPGYLTADRVWGSFGCYLLLCGIHKVSVLPDKLVYYLGIKPLNFASYSSYKTRNIIWTVIFTPFVNWNLMCPKSNTSRRITGMPASSLWMIPKLLLKISLL